MTEHPADETRPPRLLTAFVAAVAVYPFVACKPPITPPALAIRPPADASACTQPGPEPRASSTACAELAAGLHVADWRLVLDLERQVLAVWCPAEGDDCEEIYVGEAGALREIAHSPDGQSLAFLRFEPDESSCDIVFCYEGACAQPDEAVCNPNNGSLLWLPTKNLLYRASGASGLNVAALYRRDGATLWASVHVADEVSPSQRYLMLGQSSTQPSSADIDTVQVLDLASGATLATEAVAPGADVRAQWTRGSVKLRWPGGAREIALPDGGVGEGDEGEWRLFSR